MMAIMVGILTVVFILVHNQPVVSIQNFPLHLLHSQQSIKQHGNAKSVLEETDWVIGALHYPKTDIEELDELIEQTVVNQYELFQEQVRLATSGGHHQKAQFHVDYQTHLTNQRFLGVVLILTTQFQGSEDTMIKIINYDMLLQQIMDPALLFKESILTDFSSSIRSVISKEYAENVENEPIAFLKNTAADSINLNNYVLGNESVLFYFNPGVIFDKSLGIIEVEVPYQHLVYSLLVTIHPEFPPQQPPIVVVDRPKREIDPNKPMVVLTFDDGPHANTEVILDVLKKYDVGATFFVVGSRLQRFQNVLQKIVASGSEVGNHSWSHRDFTKISSSEIASEINKVNQLVYQLTGVTPTLVRPPYGKVNSRVIAASQPYQLVLWNVDTLDWRHRDAKKTVAEVKRSVKDGSVILMHDLYANNVIAVEEIVIYLLEQGFQIVTFSEMIEARQLEAAVIRHG